MSEITVMGSVEGFSGTDDEGLSLVPLTAPNPNRATIPKANRYTVKPSSGGLFSNLSNIIGNVGSWFSQNSQSITQALDAAGRLRSGVKVQADAVNEAYLRNIVNTPPRNWFEEEMLPGVKNVFLALGLLVLGGVLIARKNAPQVRP